MREADAKAAASAAAGEGLLEGKSYLFTGTLEAFNRKEAGALVKEHGGVLAKSVTKALGVLVVGAGRGQKSSKQKKAEALQAEGAAIEVLSEKDFLTRIGRDGEPAPETKAQEEK